MASRYRVRRSTFKLSLFKEDVINIRTLVEKFPNRETGGNLFGLWTNEGNAVVLVATGPGKNCERSGVSFYQDIDYMRKVGDLLTGKYPLCHIGEWHSHHKMSLVQPSTGDCHTIRRNYPTGSQGFILMIANIIPGRDVTLSPYKFVDEVSEYQGGQIEILDTENPFNEVYAIKSAINKGKEIMQENPREYPDLDGRERTVISRSRGGSLRVGAERQDRRQLYSQPHGTFDNSRQEKTPNVNYLRKANETHVPRPPSSPKQNTRYQTAYSNSKYHERDKEKSPLHQRTTAGYISPSPRPSERLNNNKLTTPPVPWYDQDEATLRETLSFIKRRSNDDQVKIERDKRGMEVSFEFGHSIFIWTVRFPNNFPHSGDVILYNRYSSCSSPRPVNTIPLAGRGLESFKELFREVFQKSCRCYKCRYSRCRSNFDRAKIYC